MLQFPPELVPLLNQLITNVSALDGSVARFSLPLV